LHGPEEQRGFAAAEEEALITISDRIFILEELVKMKILKGWQKIAGDLKTTGDAHAFSSGVHLSPGAPHIG